MSSRYNMTTRHVITYTGAVSRWQPDARERLERAAIELFATQGFAATTVPQITARAGLTTRTFFRHFADKREVLFGGVEVPESAARLLADAPASLDPATLIIGGLRSVAETRFAGRRDDLRQRRDIVRSDEGLLERELSKRAALAAVIRDGLALRGVDARTAVLLAESTVTVVNVSVDEWLDQQEEDRTLFEIILDVLQALPTALAAFSPKLAELPVHPGPGKTVGQQPPHAAENGGQAGPKPFELVAKVGEAS
jgi:AcrR family transcriptional regulator